MIQRYAEDTLYIDWSIIAGKRLTNDISQGVMMTHNNVASNVGAVNQLTTMYANDVHISYLPLAHIYECVTTINLIVVGAAIGFWHGVCN